MSLADRIYYHFSEGRRKCTVWLLFLCICPQQPRTDSGNKWWDYIHSFHPCAHATAKTDRSTDVFSVRWMALLCSTLDWVPYGVFAGRLSYVVTSPGIMPAVCQYILLFRPQFEASRSTNNYRYKPLIDNSCYGSTINSSRLIKNHVDVRLPGFRFVITGPHFILLSSHFDLPGLHCLRILTVTMQFTVAPDT